MTDLLAASLLNPDHLASTLGLLGVLAIIFAECGLLVGFFLPGDSLLFALGLLVAKGTIHTNIVLVCVLVSLAAFAGNVVGYLIGFHAGPSVFRPDRRSRFLRQEYVDRTHDFLGRYGARSIILARFVPVVRTLITVMAGVARMDARKYYLFSFIGAVLWGSGVTLLGYWLGHNAFIANHIEEIAVGIVVVSMIPVAREMWKIRKAPAPPRPAKES